MPGPHRENYRGTTLSAGEWLLRRLYAPKVPAPQSGASWADVEAQLADLGFERLAAPADILAVSTESATFFYFFRGGRLHRGPLVPRDALEVANTRPDAQETLNWLESLEAVARWGNAMSVTEIARANEPPPEDEVPPSCPSNPDPDDSEALYAHAACCLSENQARGCNSPIASSSRLLRSAELGNVKAANEVGAGYLYGYHHLPRNPSLAYDWLLYAAEAGDEIAAHNMAELYRGWHGVPHDPDLVTHWLARSADLGSAIALFELAFRIRAGIGTDPNSLLADSLLRDIENSGYGAVQFLEESLILWPPDTWAPLYEELRAMPMDNVAVSARLIALAKAVDQDVPGNGLVAVPLKEGDVIWPSEFADRIIFDLSRAAAAIGNRTAYEDLAEFRESGRYPASPVRLEDSFTLIWDTDDTESVAPSVSPGSPENR